MPAEYRGRRMQHQEGVAGGGYGRDIHEVVPALVIYFTPYFVAALRASAAGSISSQPALR